LLTDGRSASVEYDERLEKVHCFAPDYTKEALGSVLETLRLEALSGTPESRFAEFSPQFRLSTPRALLRPIDDRVREVLREKYLLKPKSADQKSKEKGVERRIDRFLSENLRVPFRAIHRRASVGEVLGFEAARELPKDLMPKPISRALIFDSAICLVDGVDLHVRSTDLLVHRVNRIAHTYWQYREVQEYFPKLGEKKILRAAIVFDGKDKTVEASLKWRADYAFHQFDKDADITIRAGSPEQELEILTRLKKLLPGNVIC
jgi:hypothetical protein